VVSTIRAVYDEYCFTWDSEDYHADLYDVEKHYDQEGHFFWVGEIDGRIVGTVALERFEPVPGDLGLLTLYDGEHRIAGCDCALQRLYVHPEARRTGMGTELFLTTIRAAKELGAKAMEIWSDKRFENAHRLYERHGAKVVADRICHDPDQSPEWGLILMV
jgi:putative acetyltransferase